MPIDENGTRIHLWSHTLASLDVGGEEPTVYYRWVWINQVTKSNSFNV